MASAADVLAQMLTLKTAGFRASLTFHVDTQEGFDLLASAFPAAQRKTRHDPGEGVYYDSIYHHEGKDSVEVMIFSPNRVDAEPVTRRLRLVSL